MFRVVRNSLASNFLISQIHGTQGIPTGECGEQLGANREMVPSNPSITSLERKHFELHLPESSMPAWPSSTRATISWVKKEIYLGSPKLGRGNLERILDGLISLIYSCQSAEATRWLLPPGKNTGANSTTQGSRAGSKVRAKALTLLRQGLGDEPEPSLK